MTYLGIGEILLRTDASSLSAFAVDFFFLFLLDNSLKYGVDIAADLFHSLCSLAGSLSLFYFRLQELLQALYVKWTYLENTLFWLEILDLI